MNDFIGWDGGGGRGGGDGDDSVARDGVRMASTAIDGVLINMDPLAEAICEAAKAWSDQRVRDASGHKVTDALHELAKELGSALDYWKRGTWVSSVVTLAAYEIRESRKLLREIRAIVGRPEVGLTDAVRIWADKRVCDAKEEAQAVAASQADEIATIRAAVGAKDGESTIASVTRWAIEAAKARAETETAAVYKTLCLATAAGEDHPPNALAAARAVTARLQSGEALHHAAAAFIDALNDLASARVQGIYAKDVAKFMASGQRA